MDIRAERRAAGLSQSQLASAAGAPQPNSSPYKNRRRAPSPEVVERIARALRVRPSARIDQHRDAIRASVVQHHAHDPRVFASVSRGDDEPGSDVDLLVDFTDEASLLDQVGTVTIDVPHLRRYRANMVIPIGPLEASRQPCGPPTVV